LGTVTKTLTTAWQLRLLIVLQVFCAAGLALLAGALLSSPLSGLPAITLGQVVLFAVSYLICAGALLWHERVGRPARAGKIIGLLALGYVPSLLFLALSKLDLPRRVLAAELLAGAGLICITAVLRRWPVLRAAALTLAVATGMALLLIGTPKSQALPSVRVWRLNSELYPLKVSEYRTLIAHSTASGGAIAPLGDRYFVTTGDGALFLVTPAGRDALTAMRLPHPIPINAPEFTAAAGQQVDATAFRVADLLAQDLNGKIRLFATHHFWKAAQQCFVVRVSMLEGDAQTFMSDSQATTAWKTIFESSPCVPVTLAGRLPHFSGIQIGGMLALLNDHELLVTLGDHELDGVNSPMSAPQDAASSYGKTVLIDLVNLSSHVFSMGHRNPQGLYADVSGEIWLTEHGPQGGDELNLIERGANYGWPLATYGVQYGTHAWPLDLVPGSHAGFTEPYYSWVPSIGVSGLVVIRGPLFKLWEGDLLVASLKDNALYRIRIRQKRVVMTERIPFGRRIRDIAEAPNGQLLLWTDRGALLRVEIDADVGRGEALFQVCAGCHLIGDGYTHGIGPDLRHIVDRPVASAPGARYSRAMRKLGGRWTKDRLDEFLKAPQTFVPGTTMGFGGLPDATSRARLIDFLASGTNRPPPED